MPSVSGSALTNVGSALGTPEYMSPEQCEGLDVDARSDVYSCGAVLYRMLVGRVPFFGTIALDTMLRHLRDPPQPPREVVPEIDPALEAIVLRALAKQPEDRQQTAAELGAELTALLPALEAREATRPLRMPALPPRPSPRRHSPRSEKVARGGEVRPVVAATGDTDPDTVPSQRPDRLRSDEVVLEPDVPTDVDLLGPAERRAAVPAPPGRVVEQRADAPSPPPRDGRGERPLGLPSPLPPSPSPLLGIRRDIEDDTLVMPGRSSDPGEAVLTTPFIRHRPPLPPPTPPVPPAPVFSGGVGSAPDLALRPSAPSLPGSDGTAAPARVRVVPLFFVTFSIVLVLGMILLRLVRGF